MHTYKLKRDSTDTFIEVDGVSPAAIITTHSVDASVRAIVAQANLAADAVAALKALQDTQGPPPCPDGSGTRGATP